jgi:hypothetical protein
MGTFDSEWLKHLNLDKDLHLQGLPVKKVGHLRLPEHTDLPRGLNNYQMLDIDWDGNVVPLNNFSFQPERVNAFEGFSFVREKIDEINRDLREKQTAALERRLYFKLNELGYSFTVASDFYKFLHDRVTKLDFDSGNDYQLWLDYIDQNNPGTLLASWRARIKMGMSGCRMNITIG